jgi:outer membrane protein TolC
MAAAEARCQAVDEPLKAAKRSAKPNIYACVVQANAANIGAWGLGGTVFGICTYLPPFDSGVRRATREQVEAQLIEQKANCDDIKLKVKRDVSAAWLMLKAADDNETISQAAATQAEESYRALQRRYDAHRATESELFDALGAFVRARLDRAVGRV